MNSEKIVLEMRSAFLNALRAAGDNDPTLSPVISRYRFTIEANMEAAVECGRDGQPTGLYLSDGMGTEGWSEWEGDPDEATEFGISFASAVLVSIRD